ncbi:MAG: hypothetical protein CVU14_07475 [Bacteroidetes bacterium HGW-Bacteroidetes-9]|jgi:hypothetical protein|nr:MAG: hypothetical protein CVU14_07475 [Bacteroidetes bacterium HGW-Bacteroidetes-9]
MKKSIFTISIVLGLISLFFLISCKKDKNPDNLSLTNGFSISGKSYSTPKGYICGPLILSSGPKGYFFILVSNSINCEWSTVYDDTFATGTGNVVTFKLWSAASDKPAIGDYSFNDQSGYYPDPFEFDGDIVGINFNCTAEEGTHYDITGGNIMLNESGSNYNIAYNLTCTGGITISGSYIGSLQLITPLFNQ